MHTYLFARAVVAVLASAASACQCLTQDFVTKLCNVDNVIRVRIMSKDTDIPNRRVVYTFRPLINYKGNHTVNSGDFTVESRIEAVACGRSTLRKGKQYIVSYYDKSEHNNHTTISLCDFVSDPNSLTVSKRATLNKLQKGTLCSSGCVKGNTTVPIGWSGTDNDGCNTCKCTKAGQISCTKRACLKKSCKVHDKDVLHGWTGIGEDGCNSCKCNNGRLACTKKKCQPHSGCVHNGAEVKEGWVGNSSDGCNTCTCSGGNVVCTLKACLGKPGCVFDENTVVPEGWSGLGPDNCNSCACSNGMLACTLMACEPEGSCLLNGETVLHGWSGKDPKSCNDCQCSSGNLRCSIKACPVTPAN